MKKLYNRFVLWIKNKLKKRQLRVAKQLAENNFRKKKESLEKEYEQLCLEMKNLKGIKNRDLLYEKTQRSIKLYKEIKNLKK